MVWYIVSIMQRGTQQSEEARRKISEAAKKRWEGIPVEMRSDVVKSWRKDLTENTSQKV